VSSARFGDRVVLITGSSSGIGRATVLALAAEGATVFAVGRRAAGLSDVARASRSLPGEVRPVRADLAVDRSVRRVAAGVESWGRGLDALIHSAGAHATGEVRSAPVGDWDRLHRVNARAPYLLTQILVPALEAARGQVIFVNSSVARRAGPGLAAYAASKLALRGLADVLRDEVNPLGIRVLSVYPGRTAGPLQQALHAREGRPYRAERLLQPEDVASAILEAMSLPRTAEITDLDIRPMSKPASGPVRRAGRRRS